MVVDGVSLVGGSGDSVGGNIEAGGEIFDIDCSPVEEWEGGEAWSPVCPAVVPTLQQPPVVAVTLVETVVVERWGSPSTHKVSTS